MLAPATSAGSYVFKLGRLTRSGIRDTFEVIEELRAHGVELVSVSDGFALDGLAAEVVLAIMAWAAKMERLAINERISAARERVEAEGRARGRPRRLDQRTHDRVVAMRAAGKSVREIAMALKVPKSTVARAVSTPPGCAPHNAGLASASASRILGHDGQWSRAPDRPDLLASAIRRMAATARLATK